MEKIKVGKVATRMHNIDSMMLGKMDMVVEKIKVDMVVVNRLMTMGVVE